MAKPNTIGMKAKIPKNQNTRTDCGVKIVRGGMPVFMRRRQQIKDGKEYVSWRLEWREGGKRRSTSRSNREKAHALGVDIATRLGKGEIRQKILSGIDLLVYERSVSICAQSDGTILDGAQLLKANKSPIPKCTVAEVRAKFLASKAKRSKRHHESLTNDTKYLTDKFGDRLILDLHVLELNEWLTTMSVGGRTKQNRWKNNRTMFLWAQRLGYLPEGETQIEKVDEALWAEELREDWEEDEGIDDVCLLTPEQLRALFDALPKRLIPVLALGAFAGFRRSEAARLHWRMVKEEHIEVPRIIARKKKKRRLAPYFPACTAWLEPCRKDTGLIIPHPDWFNQVTAIAKRIGIDWKQNVLRHSFISYRLALTQNADQVAYEAGTSKGKIDSNYDEKASRKDAEKWFATFPPMHNPLPAGDTVNPIDGEIPEGVNHAPKSKENVDESNQTQPNKII